LRTRAVWAAREEAGDRILDASMLAREQPITEVKSTMSIAPLILPKSDPASAQGGYGAALAGRF